MSSVGQAISGEKVIAVESLEPQWYAVQTLSRHEKKAAKEIQCRGIEVYLPLITETHSWSDRRKVVEVPLFSCYAFVRIVRTPESRLDVLKVNGVVNFVGDNKLGEAIPNEQIEGIRRLLENEVPFSEHTFLSVGQRVRIHGGALDGMEGILTAVNGNRRLVISIDSIQRSISVSVEGYGIEVLSGDEHRA